MTTENNNTTLDFEGINYSEAEELPSRPDVAPSGTYPARILVAEKYQSQNSGNWTLKVTFQIAGGKYRDHNEWYNLWSPVETTREISTSIFTRLGQAAGFADAPPQSAKDFEGKDLTLQVKQIEEEYEIDGEKKIGSKLKIQRYLPVDDGGLEVPSANVPPTLPF